MTKRSPSRAKPPTMRESVRAMGVLYEQLGSQMTNVAEAVTTFRSELRGDVSALEARLAGRISVLEEVVRENSAEVRKNSIATQENSAAIQQSSAAIRTLREEVAGLRGDFERRAEIGRVGALEARVTAIETRLGIQDR